MAFPPPGMTGSGSFFEPQAVFYHCFVLVPASRNMGASRRSRESRIRFPAAASTFTSENPICFRTSKSHCGREILLASMGFAVPGAFAAKMLNMDKRVLAVTGDGGFLMNSQELETAVRENIPFVTLIWEDTRFKQPVHCINLAYPRLIQYQVR